MIRDEQIQLPGGFPWGWVPWIAAALAVVGLGGAVALAGGNPLHDEDFLFSWLVSFMFWLSISLGGLFFVCVLFVTRAGWGVVVRRIAENAAILLPLFAVLFIPIWLGRHELYHHWMDAEIMAGDAILQSKAWWLNDGGFGFSVRALIYFVVWCLFAWFYYSGSRRQDQTGDHAISRRLQATSGPAIIVFAFTVSLAAIDWIMSLDPHWYSTMFGVYYFAGSLIAIFAFVIAALVTLQWGGALTEVVSDEHFHDMGKLMFAFTVFWAYIGFSQYFLIWYGNLPEETVWYAHRMEGSWSGVTLMLAIGHFVIPFFFFMPRTIKRIKPLMLLGAKWMLFMHLVDIYWLIMPVESPHGMHITAVQVLVFLGMTGVVELALYFVMKRSALIPVKDPRLPESLAFENF